MNDRPDARHRPRAGARPVHGGAPDHPADAARAGAKVGAFAAFAPIIAACRRSAPRRRGPVRRARPLRRRTAPPSRPRRARPPRRSPPRRRRQPPRLPRPSCSSRTGTSTSARTIQSFVEKIKNGTTRSSTIKFPDCFDTVTKGSGRDGKPAAASTSPSRPSTDVPGLVRDRVSAARPVADPEPGQPRHRVAEPGLRPGQRALDAVHVVDDRLRLDTAKIKEDADQLERPLGRALEGPLAMLDDQREVFAAGALRLGFRAEHDGRRELDQIARPAQAAEAARPDVHRRRHRRFTGPAVDDPCLVRHDWVQMIYDPSTKKPSVEFVIPRRAPSAARTRWSSVRGAKHPIAAHLWINYNLDAQVSAANSNYIGYMGPNAAAKAVHHPASSARPGPEPGQGRVDKLAGAARPRADDLDKYTQRARTHELKAGG